MTDAAVRLGSWRLSSRLCDYDFFVRGADLRRLATGSRICFEVGVRAVSEQFQGSAAQCDESTCKSSKGDISPSSCSRSFVHFFPSLLVVLVIISFRSWSSFYSVLDSRS